MRSSKRIWVIGSHATKGAGAGYHKPTDLEEKIGAKIGVIAGSWLEGRYGRRAYKRREVRSKQKCTLLVGQNILINNSD